MQLFEMHGAGSVKENVDILVISNTKLDESFLEEQYKIPNFTNLRWNYGFYEGRYSF